MVSIRTCLLLAVAFLAVPAASKLKGKECEVCIKVLNKIQEGVDVSDPNAVEESIRSFCKSTKVAKEDRFCYYIGGSETSATGMLNMITGPLKRYLPTEKVCESIKKKDSQVCELVYDVPIDLSTMDLKKQRVKTLRKILNDQFNDPCKGCIEKSDYIKKIYELAPESRPKEEL